MTFKSEAKTPDELRLELIKFCRESSDNRKREAKLATLKRTALELNSMARAYDNMAEFLERLVVFSMEIGKISEEAWDRLKEETCSLTGNKTT